MSGDYPTDEELERLTKWDYNDAPGWFAFAKEVGNYWPDDEFWDEVNGRYYISTGGWSGNEDIIAAMRENRVLWMFWWESHRSGGHYSFASSAVRHATGDMYFTVRRRAVGALPEEPQT